MLAGLVPSEAVRENLCQALPPAAGGLLAISGIPWLVDASLGFCLHLHRAFSLCLWMCPNFPLYKNTVTLG